MQPTTAVIYLWAQEQETADTAFEEQAKRCEAYAYRFCWDVVETIRDVGGSNEAFDPETRVHAFARPGLGQVLALLMEHRAAVVLVPDLRMLGGTSPVVEAVREEVEKFGFVLVVGDPQ